MAETKRWVENVLGVEIVCEDSEWLPEELAAVMVDVQKGEVVAVVQNGSFLQKIAEGVDRE